MMWCLAGSYFSWLRGDDHLLGARLDVPLRILLLGEAARALEHDVDAVLAVGQLAGIALGRDGDALAVDDHRVLSGLDLAVEDAVDRVVLEEVRERRRLVDVVEQGHLEVRPALDGSAQDVAADASEPVDGEAGHVVRLLEGRHT